MDKRHVHVCVLPTTHGLEGRGVSAPAVYSHTPSPSLCINVLPTSPTSFLFVCAFRAFSSLAARSLQASLSDISFSLHLMQQVHEAGHLEYHGDCLQSVLGVMFEASVLLLMFSRFL